MPSDDFLDFEMDVLEQGLPPQADAQSLPQEPSLHQLLGAALSSTFAGYLDQAARGLPSEAPEALRSEAQALVTAISTADDPLMLVEQLQARQNAWRQLMTFYADQAEMAEAMHQLLHTVVDNLDSLAQDQWVSGQMTAVRELIDSSVDARQVVRAEQRLQSAAQVQSAIQSQLASARTSMEDQLASAGREMERVTQVADVFHTKLDNHATRVRGAKDINELAGALSTMLSDTNTVRQSVRKSRDELGALQKKTQAAEAEIRRLQEELAAASQLARHDPLTGALNRKGLEDAFAREHSRMTRRCVPMCLALIDIDNFKSINDQLGHAAGDEALVHLSKVAKAQLRASDTLGRFGGEEFVILMPDTELDDAEQVLIRVQRALTKEIFMGGGDKRLITFSAGVTVVQPNDGQAEAQERADAAMYTAKRTGKNKVVRA